MNRQSVIKLAREVASAGLSYRQPPTPKGGNCLFHAMRDQLTRMEKPSQTASKLRAGVVCPTTPGKHA